MAWTTRDMPSQAGKLAVVTGANAGLGYETALALAAAGAEVVVAARNSAKGEAAVGRILERYPSARARLELVDLASLASVRDFAVRIADGCKQLDLLINNAGMMMPPRLQTTQDGFELQFGVNYLAHYALTAQLLAPLRRAPAPRVVSLSSGVHHTGAIAFDDLNWARRPYSAMGAYSQSKLAMLMFAFELQRRSDAAGWGLVSNAAHPGYARTELIANGPGAKSAFGRVTAVLGPLISQSAADGALPTLFAATSPEAVGGGYYGPSHMFEMKGPPKRARVAPAARAAAAAARLWDVSETLTGVGFG